MMAENFSWGGGFVMLTKMLDGREDDQSHS